jgi:hypothetical protein
MRQIINRMLSLFFVLGIFLNVPQLYAEDSNSTLKILWQKEFDFEDGLNYSPDSVLFNKVSNTLLIAGASFQPTDKSIGKIWLWEVDSNGNIVRRSILKNISKNEISGEIARDISKELSVSKNGNISTMLLFKNSEHKQSAIRISQADGVLDVIQPTIVKDTTPEHIGHIFKAIPIDDSVLAIGSDDGEGLAVKFDSKGKEIWNKVYDLGKSETLFDGTAVGNEGGFLVVGRSSDSEAPFNVNVFALLCNAEGEVVAKDIFPGNPLQLPRACQLTSKDFVVAYAIGTEFTRIMDLNIRAYTPDLKLLWEKEVVRYNKGTFSMATIPNGNFILVIKKHHPDILEVYEYDENGNKTKNTSINQAVGSFSVNIASIKNKIFLIFNTSYKDRKPTKVKIIALES